MGIPQTNRLSFDDTIGVKSNMSSTVDIESYKSSLRQTHHGHSHGHTIHEKQQATKLNDTYLHTIDLDLNHDNLSAASKLRKACMWSIFFMVVQFVGGYYAGSLAIMTDAAHMLSDVASFIVSLFAVYIGALPGNAKMPFGYHRAEVISALISVLVIWVLTVTLLYTAIQRMLEEIQPGVPDTVNGKAMFVVSSFGLGVNLVLMKILGHSHSHLGGGGHSHCENSHSHSHGSINGHTNLNALESPNVQNGDIMVKTPKTSTALMIDPIERDDHSNAHGKNNARGVDHSHHAENINVQAAYIHALGDFIQSLGVCIAGGLIWYNPDWQVADPITTIIFSLMALATTVGIFHRSVLILMEAAPHDFDLKLLSHQINSLDSVESCHDLHVWVLTEGHYAASVHIIPTMDTKLNKSNAKKALRDVQVLFKAEGIRMQTVQVEDPADVPSNEELFCVGLKYEAVDTDCHHSI